MNSISQTDTVVHRTGTTTVCVKKLSQHSCSSSQTRDLDRILGPEGREGRAKRTKLGGERLSKDAPLGQPSGPSGTIWPPPRGLREMVTDREAWHAAVHGVEKGPMRLSD